MSSLSALPRCMALLVCNDVIEDKRTNNKTLVGLFNRITAPRLPTKHPRLYIFISITDFSGTAPLAVRISSPSKEVMTLNGELKCEDAAAVADIVLELQALPLEEPGRYHIELIVSGMPIADRFFHVTEGGHPLPAG